jgi:hypothetical protein
MKTTTTLLSIAMMFVFTISKAQTTAMPLSGLDCNGNYHSVFDDLDAGKAVILHFFMPSCGSCAPPAQKIQTMANRINTAHPGMVTAYAMPYNNTTTCAYTSTWCSSNGLSLYMPYDSGAVQVAHYGGFGMPTVVLLGGANHRVMFSTLSFSTSDTLRMRDSILNLLNSATGIKDLPNTTNTFSVFPNPAKENISIQFELKEISSLLIDVTDITGKQLAIIADEKITGIVTKQYNITSLPNGIYFVRLQVNGKTSAQKLTINH